MSKNAFPGTAVCDNLSELREIDAAPLDDGTACWVRSAQDYFILDRQVGFPADGENVVRSVVGNMPWKRMGISSDPVTFIYRPGDPNPIGNVFNNFTTLYTALQFTPGLTVLQIDDSIVSPAVIPAGTYNLEHCTLSGNLENGVPTFCTISDGVVFTKIESITDQLVLNCMSISVPAHSLTSGDIFVIDKGSQVKNDPTSTVPFFHIPAGLAVAPIIVLTLGGKLGTTGNHVVQVDAGGSFAVVADVLAEIKDDVLTGAGSAFILVTSQSTFANSPSPILQPSVTGGYQVVIYDFANYVSFMNLTAGNWAGAAPTNVEDAINRMASLLKTLNGGAPIP
jgi:hypothetical protein